MMRDLVCINTLSEVMSKGYKVIWMTTYRCTLLWKRYLVSDWIMYIISEAVRTTVWNTTYKTSETIIPKAVETDCNCGMRTLLVWSFKITIISIYSFQLKNLSRKLIITFCLYMLLVYENPFIFYQYTKYTII